MTDIGVITSKSQLPIQALYYGDDEKRYQWKKYEIGDLVCSGKEGYFPSEERLNEMYEELRTDLDDPQEKKYAFKFAVSSESDVIQQGKVVNFDEQIYDGVFTAPVGLFRIPL